MGAASPIFRVYGAQNARFRGTLAAKCGAPCSESDILWSLFDYPVPRPYIFAARQHPTGGVFE
jgi:hypothetical protein